MLPTHEVELDEQGVRALLVAQHPDLADRPLVRVAAGWDNLMFRLGDDLAVRLPARAVAVDLLAHESRWLPALAPLLPVAVPLPVRLGRPAPSFGWPWSIVIWTPGVGADTLPVAGRVAWAPALAATFTSLHVSAPPDAPSNPFRGVPLRLRDEVVRARLAASPDRELLIDAWLDALAAPPWSGPAVWLHGDPHPANLVVDDGRLAALVDFGDLTAGDPATDLCTAWLTFDEQGRTAFREHLPQVDAATWRRARGWAAAMVPTLLAHPADHPTLAAVGRHATAQLAATG